MEQERALTRSITPMILRYQGNSTYGCIKPKEFIYRIMKKKNKKKRIMKYILLPIIKAVFAVLVLIFLSLQWIWIPFWECRIPSVREVYSLDGEYLFENDDVTLI